MLRVLFAGLGIVLLTLAVFRQTTGFEFINYDDPAYVTLRPELAEDLSLSALRNVFSESHFGNYSPLTELSFRIDGAIYGLDAAGFHRTNVVLHVLNALLLLLFLYRATGAVWTSALVAALFAIHPLHVESVAWVSERKDLVCALFWLLAFHAYLGYTRAPSVWRYLLTMAMLCLSLLAKPMAVTLPFVLLLLDVWPLGRFAGKEWKGTARRLVLEKAPMLVPVVAIAWVTIAVQADSGAMSDTASLTLPLRVANAIRSYGVYLVQAVAPVDLIPMYPYPVGGVPLWQLAGSTAFLVAASVVAFVQRIRRPWLAVGWLWYVGTLVPVIGFVQVGEQAHADRYTYLPLVGIFIILAQALSEIATRWPRLRIPVVATALAVLVALSVAGDRQTRHWRDSVTLWTHTIKVDDTIPVAHSSLGVAYLDQGERDLAQHHLERVLELREFHRVALANLARLAVERGQIDEGVRYCRRVLERYPEDVATNTTLGGVRLRQGDVPAARRHLEQALEVAPDNADALTNYGAVWLIEGDAERAREVLEHAVARAPDDPVALTNLAAAYHALKDFERSSRYCDAALRNDPDYPQALRLRAALDRGNE